ncbi:hypothetical protein [Psychrobacter sp. DAB_AL43B]|uniref:hypothetical protein n=1 Tax=Psychrobacter sp. DAB_AL43B TaxID=1028416 RepID=UPI001555BDC7|nr:hypothetical protein [Psychrobacter sp. DAB_AL43B]
MSEIKITTDGAKYPEWIMTGITRSAIDENMTLTYTHNPAKPDTGEPYFNIPDSEWGE